MTNDPASNPIESDNPAPSDDLGRSIMRKFQRSRQAFSPWVQRWLQADTPAAGNQIRRMTAHVQRAAAGRTAQLGSLQPALVDRFAARIISRFPEVDAAEDTSPLTIDQQAYPDLVLPRRLSEARDRPLDIESDVIEAAETESDFDPIADEIEEEAPLPTISMKELREKLAARNMARTGDAPPAPPVQRRLDQPSGAVPPQPAAVRPTSTSRPMPPRARRYVQVEEGRSSVSRPPTPPAGPISPGQPQTTLCCRTSTPLWCTP
jgi:hypothetical protein